MKWLAKLSQRPIWAALLSALVAPGVGQIYNRDYKRGVMLLLLSVGSFFWFSNVLTEQLSVILPGNPDMWMKDAVKFRDALLMVVKKNPDMFLTFYALMILTWIFAVVDAYLSARHHIPTLHSDETADPER